MRSLTLGGFTKKYVSSLSRTGSCALYSLVREAEQSNARLREPLYLYAVFNNCLSTLLSAARDTALFNEYNRLASTYSPESLRCALEAQSPELDSGYLKVWASYRSVVGAPERNNRVKGYMRTRIVEIKAQANISTYRLCKDLNLNPANVNSWLKHDNGNKVGIDTARRILEYVETKTK